MVYSYVARKSSAQQRPSRVEYSAGGVVFRRMPHGPEIAFIEDPWHKWTFAKGHIEKGESTAQTALRETSEEMGVRQNVLRLIKPLGRIDWWFREQYQGKASPKGTLIHKFAHYFLMQVSPDIQFKPQRKERIHAVHWVPLSQALKRSSYKDVQPVLKKVVEYLVSHMGPNKTKVP